MKFSVVLAVLAAAISASEACSCIYWDWHHQYCDAQIVVRAVVLDEGTLFPFFADQGFVRYRIIVTKIIKSPNNSWKYRVKLWRAHSVWTGSNSALCGIKFEKYQTYIIMGYEREDEDDCAVSIGAGSCGGTRVHTKKGMQELKTFTCPAPPILPPVIIQPQPIEEPEIPPPVELPGQPRPGP